MIRPMIKVQLAFLKSVEAELLSWLQEREVLHVTKIGQEDTGLEAASDMGELEDQLAQIQFGLEFIERVRSELHLEKKRAWRDIFAGKPIATLGRLQQTLKSLDLKQMIGDMKQASDDLAEIKEEIAAGESKLVELMPWRQLALRGADNGGSRQVAQVLLKVNLAEQMLVMRKLQSVNTLALQEVGRVALKKKGDLYLEVVVDRKQEAALKKVIESTSAEVITVKWPDDVTIGEHIEELRAQVAASQKDYQKRLDGARDWLKTTKRLQFAYDALLHEKERRLTKHNMVYLAHAQVVSGWVPQDVLAELKRGLAKDWPAAALETVTPGKDEVPPVSLKNSPLMQPFETVTSIYGRPKYSELDPTPLLSIFFLVAFGLALTDAGYGLVMMAGTWAALKWLNLKKPMAKMVRLLFYGGASTTFFGALTGGWFGIDLASLPAGEIKNVLLSIKIIDPISQPLTLLMVAFVFGIVQLLFAWGVKGYDDWRKGNLVAVVFDDIAWISMIVFLLLWAGTRQGLLPAGGETLWLYLTLGNAALLVLTQGREHKNPLLKLGAGLLSLYGLINFLSDTLSYSRLLALGLATGIIALVVNLIGTMIVDALGPIGWIVAAVVLLGGHVFNLAINTLGAFIHSGRLQFVEFFPKFVEGGGSAYQPLGRVSRYVDNPGEFA